MGSALVWFALISCVSAALNYNFTVPYAGAGTLIVNNNGGSSVSITKIVFTTNAVLEGSPWGSLFPYGATIETQVSGILTTYTISSSTGVSISGGGTSSMTYSYSSTGGPLGLGMGPSYVAVALNGGAVSALPIAGMCEGDACNDPTPGYHSSGYYPSWGMYARAYNAINIPISHINQIYYAFIGFDAQGTLSLLDSNSDGKQLPVIAQLRQKYPYLHASLTFGGWTLSAPWSELANSSDTIQTFVSNAMAALQETQFDGIDIDWEYPVMNGAPGEPSYLTPQDALGYADLLVALREGLNNLSASNKLSGAGPTELRLSIAGPGGVDKLQTIDKIDPTAWSRIIKAVDVVNVMTYDFHGAFDESDPEPYDVSDFMSPMETSPLDPNFSNSLYAQYDVVSPIAMYLQLGFSPKQISLGLPAYGRLVQVEAIEPTFGLYQVITGTPPGQYDSTGTFDYKCIKEQQCHGYTQLPTDMVFVNPDDNSYGNMSHTPWGYSPSTSTFLTYDDASSAGYKVCWAMSQNLYGYMLWDMSGDFPPSDENSIIGAATAAVLGTC